VVLHDVTELRRLERVRQDFVANVSHEFKTPLTAIQGFSETLLAGAIEDPRNNRRFLEIIRDHAIRLARLTDDLLKLARIEAGKAGSAILPVSVLDLVERCAETALMKADRKQIALEIDVPPGLPSVRGDAGLLRDVLQNLIDNAIQYTPPAGKDSRERGSARAGGRAYRGRYRHRNPSRRSGADLRALLPRRRGTLARSRRNRPGLVDRQTHRGSPRRPAAGGERSRRRLEVLLLDPRWQYKSCRCFRRFTPPSRPCNPPAIVHKRRIRLVRRSSAGRSRPWQQPSPTPKEFFRACW
jgi:hypothetical protein